MGVDPGSQKWKRSKGCAKAELFPEVGGGSEEAAKTVMQVVFFICNVCASVECYSP